MKDIRIRLIENSDYNQWLPLWNSYNEFYGRIGSTALPDAVTQATWSRFFDSFEPVHAIVAEHSGELVGMAQYLFHRSTNQLNSVCYLHDLFTKQSARKMGVGKKLIEGVYAHAKSQNAPSVYWHTHHTNTTAMRLYDQVSSNSGFIVYKTML